MLPQEDGKAINPQEPREGLAHRGEGECQDTGSAARERGPVLGNQTQVCVFKFIF
jgi:hypothetical protein